jgi:hypothetical protein
MGDLPPGDALAMRARRLSDLMLDSAGFAGKKLTSDWTTYNILYWTRLLKRQREQPVRILEIGFL